MKIIDYILISLWLIKEKLKGKREFIQIPSSKEDNLESYTKSFFGYGVHIYVERICYQCTYSNTLFKKQKYVTFKVHSVMDSEAPELIRQAWNVTYTFPKMLPTFMPLAYHLERAVDSYAELVVRKNLTNVE